MSQLPDSDPFSLDNRLRSAYAADDAAANPTPPARMRLWAGLQPHLHPVAPPAPRRAPLLAGVGGLVLGVLLMWGWMSRPALAPTPLAAAHAHTPDVRTPQTESISGTVDVHTPPNGFRPGTVDVHTPQNGMNPGTVDVHTPQNGISSGTPDVRGAAVATVAVAPAALAISPAASTTGLAAPVVVLAEAATPALAPTILLPLLQTETTLAGIGTDTARATRERRTTTLLAQRAALVALSRRTDSLLLALGVAPEPVAAADSLLPLHPSTLLPSHRWSVAVAFAPERNFFGLNAREGDSLSALRRTHEQGRGGWNAALLAEYRVNDRWSVGVGAGVSSYGAELRLTDRRTLVTVRFDTALTHTVRTQVHTTSAYSVPLQPQLTPHYNLSGHVIGFDTVWVQSPDTTWTHLTQVLVDSATTRTITPTITKREEVSARVLRPNYRFLTVPVLVRYRLGRAGGTWHQLPGGPAPSRWWADVALGAQVQFFLGGTQLTSADGRTWRTERVGVGGGPFRPITVALTGALTLNYALSPALSASVAPTLRYQTESLYRASTGLTQRPAATGVQLGLRYAF